MVEKIYPYIPSTITMKLVSSNPAPILEQRNFLLYNLKSFPHIYYTEKFFILQASLSEKSPIFRVLSLLLYS